MTVFRVIHTAQEIAQLLPQLDEHIAEELETEALDFKECRDAVELKRLAVKGAICLGNASGGTMVFGIKERVRGQTRAVVGIDFAPDLNRLKGEIYDSIDPKLLVEFEWLDAGPVRLLLMHIPSSKPPHTTTRGEGWMRVGRECKPLTGSLLHHVRERAGLTDPTPRPVPIADPLAALSPSALEILRRELRAMGAPRELPDLPDWDLCAKLGIIRDGALTMGGLLFAGREEVIAEHAPHHEWKYSRLRSDVELDMAPVGGRDAILAALDKIMLVLGQVNPVTTIPSGLFHPEFPEYPTVALREALLNAFAHRDYDHPGMVFIRQYRDRLEVNSPGGFVGNVTPENILDHPPVTRNRYLVETVLLATRLVNRNNLGVPRMFRALLEEGKEPPSFSEVGETVRVTFPGHEGDQIFKGLLRLLLDVQKASLDVHDLLLLHFFRRRRQATWGEIREAYPYDDRRLRDKLARLEYDLLMLERRGSGSGMVYTLSRRAAAIVNQGTAYDLTRRLDREAITIRMLTLLKERPLTNREVRDITDLNRQQVTELLRELADEGLIRLEGRARTARWHLVERE